MAAAHMLARALRNRCLFTQVNTLPRQVKVCDKHQWPTSLPSMKNTIPRFCSSVAVQSEQKPEIVKTGQVDDLYSSIDLEVKGHDPAVLKSYTKFVSMAAGHLGINFHIQGLTKDIDKYTLLKSVHIHKKALVQYEMRTYNRRIRLQRLTGSTADTVLEYIQRNLPEGVAMKVTKHRLVPLPKHLKNPVGVIEETGDEKLLTDNNTLQTGATASRVFTDVLDKDIESSLKDSSDDKTSVTNISVSPADDKSASNHAAVDDSSSDSSSSDDSGDSSSDEGSSQSIEDVPDESPNNESNK